MIANENLLTAITSVFEDDQQIGTATGKVLPKWDQQPPDWVLKYCHNGLLSLANYGDATLISDSDPGIWSCHQAIRRNVLFEAGGFNPENTDGVWIGDGETGLNIKIKNLGYRFAYQPLAITYHFIPAARTTQAYLNKRLKNQGNCDSYTDFRKDHPGVFALSWSSFINILRVPKFLIKSIIQKSSHLDSWHMTRAYAGYFLSRSLYGVKLLLDERFKKMVLKDDWLTE